MILTCFTEDADDGIQITSFTQKTVVLSCCLFKNEIRDPKAPVFT